MKFSKYLSIICMLSIGCSLCVFGADTKSVDSVQKQSVVQNKENDTSVDETTLPIGISGTKPVGNDESKFSTFWVFVRMILVLAFVLACIYAVVHFMKKGLPLETGNDPFLRKVSSISLSPGKSVQIITLLDNAYLIGVTDNAINLIGQVSDRELVDAMNLYADKNAKNTKPRNFNDILSLFMPTNKEHKTVYGDSAKNASDLLKRQRNRLNKGDRT